VRSGRARHSPASPYLHDALAAGPAREAEVPASAAKGPTGRPLLAAPSPHTVSDLVFAPDPLLAPRHCEISPAPQGAILRDLSGGLGTFIRLAEKERPLKQGDRVRIGQQTLTVELAA